MTEFTTTSRGDRVAFDRRGLGPPLIFVAAAGQFRGGDEITTATADAAARQGLTTIVYDRLGRGESPAEGPITLEREIAAIAALIEVAGGHAVLCGHSSGSSIALAATHAGLPVAGLVLWEAPLGPEDGGGREWAAEFERRLDEDNDREAAFTWYMKDLPAEWLEGLKHSPMYARLVDWAPSLRADAQSLAWAESAPHPRLFADIRVPVEVVIGEQTLPIMESAAASIVGAIPGSTLVRMPGANHAWEVEPMAAELTAFVMVLG